MKKNSCSFCRAVYIQKCDNQKGKNAFKNGDVFWEKISPRVILINDIRTLDRDGCQVNQRDEYGFTTRKVNYCVSCGRDLNTLKVGEFD